MRPRGNNMTIEALLDTPAAIAGKNFYAERHASSSHTPYSEIGAMTFALALYGISNAKDAVLFVEGAEASRQELGGQNV